MAIALTSTGWWIYIDQAITPKAVVACVIIYNSAFGMSWGPIPWLYPPEIMPLPFRAKGVSLSTATNWLANYWVGVTTPLFQEIMGWRLYIMHACFCVLSFILGESLGPAFANPQSSSSTPRRAVCLSRRWTSSSATRGREATMTTTTLARPRRRRWWPACAAADPPRASPLPGRRPLCLRARTTHFWVV